MAHADIDRVGDFTIRKLQSPNRTKVFGYIAGPKNSDGNIDIKCESDSLTAIRDMCREYQGITKPRVNVSALTLPKSAHMQNRKGYRADMTNGTKKQPAHKDR